MSTTTFTGLIVMRNPIAEIDRCLGPGRKKDSSYRSFVLANAISYPPSQEERATKTSIKPQVCHYRWNQVWKSQSSKVVAIPGPDYAASPIRSRFQALVAEWKEATCYLSSSDDIAMHSAYQQIIGMGSDALPLIFQELRLRGGYWYWALKAITGDDPVPVTDRGKVPLMKRAWLEWAEDRGL